MTLTLGTSYERPSISFLGLMHGLWSLCVLTNFSCFFPASPVRFLPNRMSCKNVPVVCRNERFLAFCPCFYVMDVAIIVLDACFAPLHCTGLICEVGDCQKTIMHDYVFCFLPTNVCHTSVLTFTFLRWGSAILFLTFVHLTVKSFLLGAIG